MTSLKWIKRITGIGLSFMSPDAQKERMDSVFEDGEINGPALAALIDECKTAAGAFLEKYTGILSGAQETTLREILKQTDGKQTVANMAACEDAAWLLELKESIPLSVEDIARL